jgi:hypothetical protein
MGALMAEKTLTDFLPGTYIVERPSPDRSWDYGPYGTTASIDDDCDVEIEADSYDTDPTSGSLRLWRAGAVIAVFRSWAAIRIKDDATASTDD